MKNLRPATEDEIKSIIIKFGLKCLPEDPIPAKLLTNSFDIFVSIWLELVNLFLEHGSNECLKSAMIYPLLKGIDSILNTRILKNYRPVSNLQLVGQIIERVLGTSLDEHVDNNN